eukprot:scaffold12258_cov180-Isochrysis_galbana.AAC.1
MSGTSIGAYARQPIWQMWHVPWGCSPCTGITAGRRAAMEIFIGIASNGMIDAIDGQTITTNKHERRMPVLRIVPLPR